MAKKKVFQQRTPYVRKHEMRTIDGLCRVTIFLFAWKKNYPSQYCQWIERGTKIYQIMNENFQIRAHEIIDLLTITREMKYK